MRVIELGSKTGSGTGAVTAVGPLDKYTDELVGVFQATFTSTGTAVLEGTLADTGNYTTIATIASTDTTRAKTVALMPLMRLNVTANAGTVVGYLGV